LENFGIGKLGNRKPISQFPNFPIPKYFQVLNQFKHITTFVFDVDGVLTDGSLFVLPDGLMARRMNIKDGYALQLAVKKGYNVVIISGGNSPEVKERLVKLGITEVWMQVTDKLAVLEKFMQQHQLNRSDVLYMGDDIPDLQVMQAAGLPCCPADAAQEIKEKATYISHLKGGDGCARDVIEKVMKLRGNWGEDTSVRSQ
jgi:3-deoxy-D-manno-octulosonate 8-phosphate phosphatase (KDO 8-P phosphatase)